MATPYEQAATAACKRRRDARAGDQRIAVVGMAVHYAGCPNKEIFWDSLIKKGVNSGPLSETRLGTKNKSLHYRKERSKYSDTFCNDRYATIEEKYTNEHDLLLKLAREALNDAAVRKGVNEYEVNNCGIVSGCLSFPRDDTQGELLNLYQSHVEAKFGEVFDGVSLFNNQEKWSTRATSLNVAADDKKSYMDPASFVADELNLNGLHYSIDAACASALYVLRLAQEHLLSGNADIMLAGASTLPDPFFIVSGFSTFQAMPVAGTKDDISLPWHSKSTGLTPGEGGAIMVLKRLSDAVRDGDHIYGTLMGVGINNAGCGLPLKPHMPSELGCMRETYNIVESGAVKYGEPGFSKNVQYVECHATGTSQGDRVEIDAMRECFGKLPLFGSTKGNFGHTLVAAGFAGMCKLLLSMEKGQIPPTPGVDAVSSMDKNVVKDVVPWPDTNGDVKRGALSAFGFGGTNGHAVFEEYVPEKKANILAMVRPSTPVMPKLDIVGMDCHFGTLNGLSAFERALYNAGNGACLLPEKRWRFMGTDKRFLETLEIVSRPYGCFIDSVPVDFRRLRTPLTPEDMLMSQQLVAVKTIDKAIQDANLAKGGRVAVLVGLGTDMELYRHRGRVALKERLHSALLEANDGAVMNALMDYVHDRGTSTSYTSYIGNLVATRISSQWGFVGPSFSVTEGESSVFRCLEIGRLLLAIGNVDAVVIAGVDLCGNAENLYFKTRRHKMSTSQVPQASFSKDADGFFIGEGAGALVLKIHGDSCGSEKSYASIDSMVAGKDVYSCASEAVEKAGISHDSVEMIDVSGLSGDFMKLDTDYITSEEEISKLGEVYRGKTPAASASERNVSISSVQGNVGYTGYASGAASLIKSALALYNRYLPGTSSFESPREEDSFPESFHVNKYSTAWVKDSSKDRRYVAVSSVSDTNSYFHTILSDIEGQHESQSLSSIDPKLPKVVCICAESVDAILEKLAQIQNRDDFKTEFGNLVRDTLKQETKQASAGLVLSLVATEETLSKEIASALKGIPRAIKLKRDYTSSSGSFLTLNPLKSDKIAFMYGEGRSPYLGLGKDMFRVWPGMHEFIQDRTTDMWARNGDDEFHPRCLNTSERAAREEEFDRNMISNFRSGVFHSVCFTGLAQEKLGLKPKASFGLSLGEISMMFAFSRSNSLLSNEMTARLAASPVWNEELAVKCNAVRKKWNFPDDEPLEKYWTGFMVQGSRKDIEDAIGNRDDVRLMIVNSSTSALIAGKPDACTEIIKKLGDKPALQLPQRMIGHSPEVAPCVEQIGQIHAMLEIPATDHQMYTTVENAPLKGGILMKNHAGNVYLKIADFPAIVERVYADGYDTFVELGADNTRASSVKQILATNGNKIQRAHVAVAIDREGKDTWSQIMTMMAVLKSHQTPGATLCSLYHKSLMKEPAKVNKLLRSIELNGRYKGISKTTIPDNILNQLRKSNVKMRQPDPYKKIRATNSFKAKSRSQKRSLHENIIHSENPQDVGFQTQPEPEDDILTVSADLKSAFLQLDKAIRLPTVPGSRSKSRVLEPVTILDLGDENFMKCYGVCAPLYSGAMAKGIASADLVIAMGKRGLLGSFGAGGLPIHVVEKALNQIQAALPNGPFAVNLIHSPFDPNLEKGCIDLLLKRNVTVVEASAFMQLTYDVVRYRVAGLFKINTSEKINDKNIGIKNKMIAKISRTELAEMFIRPAPEVWLKKLLANGDITMEQYEMAKLVPMADDITVESDSGGHTDNRPLHVVFPIVLNLRNKLNKELGYPAHLRVRVGAAGGIGCPEAAAAAFNIGAAFVVTGTVNQLCRQSGSSDIVRRALASASYSDITMAPAADMFEQGVELQVLKKGTMFPSRAKKLRELFVKYDSFEEMPTEERGRLENRIFRKSINEVWQETTDFYVNHLKNPEKIARAEKDKKLKMSLCMRWYLGLSSFWANNGIKERAMDYQVWCGPAIGSFNDFIRGTYLDVKNPNSNGQFPCVVQTNLEILNGACYIQRIHQVQSFRDVDIDLDSHELRTYRPVGPL